MKHLSKKIVACLAIIAMCCFGCKANTSSSEVSSSSQASVPKVKITKKATAKTAKQPEQAAITNPQINVVVVSSDKMKRDITNLVIVPKQYLDSDKEQYPVVYLLHGYDDNYMAWQNHINLAELASKYGMIFVCPDGQDGWYFDSPIDPSFQFETFITQELRNYVEQNYRTINDAQHRAITGLSMGGHGALWLGWRHPDLYGSCGSMSGAVDIMTLKDRFKIDKRLGKYAANTQSWRDHSVINLVPTLKNGEQNIIIDDGTQDFLIKENRALHAALDKHGIKHSYSERPGRHSWDYWVKSLTMHLDFFAKHF